MPPLRVIRRDVGALKPASIAVLAAGTVGFTALLLSVSPDLKMGLIAVGGLVYGLSYPSLNASNPPQTVGSAPSHARSGHPL